MKEILGKITEGENLSRVTKGMGLWRAIIVITLKGHHTLMKLAKSDLEAC